MDLVVGRFLVVVVVGAVVVVVVLLVAFVSILSACSTALAPALAIASGQTLVVISVVVVVFL